MAIPTQPTPPAQPGQPPAKVQGAPFSGDPRDTYVAPEDVNASPHYVMYSVFSTVVPLPAAKAASWAAASIPRAMPLTTTIPAEANARAK